jgi:hypothetical protein
MNYYVMCRLDETMDDNGNYTVQGKYVLATSRSFPTYGEAEIYSGAIAPSREPRILLEVSPLDVAGGSVRIK